MPLINRDQNNCCGCSACVQICPVSCIQMKEDHEGFLYPGVDLSTCINCGKCDSVCPVLNRCKDKDDLSGADSDNKTIAVFAAQHKDPIVLRNSSSGGVFRLIADFIIQNNGTVFGCKLNSSAEAVYDSARTIEDAEKFQGSKYVAVDCSDVYKRIQSELNSVRPVLFAGSPCQCAALFRFLGCRPQNLITIDFLCHGMPSSRIFKAYVDFLKEKRNSAVSNIKFRDKSARGWGLWFSYCYLHHGKYKKCIENAKINPYEYAFQKSFMNRYICYECPFQGIRSTDFTMADYWGFDSSATIERDKGVSILSVNSSKAMSILDSIKENAFLELTNIDVATKENKSLVGKEKRTIPQIRYSFYHEVFMNGWEWAARNRCRHKYYYLYRIWYSIPASVAKTIKVIKETLI